MTYGERHALCTVTGWEDLARDGPHNRAPRHRERGDEQAREDDHGVADALVRCSVAVGQREVAQRSEDEEAHEHPERAVDQRGPATVLLDDVETGERHAEVDGTEDDGGNVRVRDPNGVEDRGTVVEVVVCASKLLQCLERNGEHRAVQHARTSENLVPRMVVTTCVFCFQFLLNLADLSLHMWVVLRDSIAEREGAARALDLSIAVLPARRLLHEQNTDNHQERPDEANAHGDLPRAGAPVGFCAEVDTVRDEDSERDEELVARHERATDVSRRGLGLVHGREDREAANTEACYPSTKGYLVPDCGGGDLDNDTDAEDDVPEDDAVLAAELVGDRRSDQCTYQGTNGELWRVRFSCTCCGRIDVQVRRSTRFLSY
jgi:hypothetical protein